MQKNTKQNKKNREKQNAWGNVQLGDFRMSFPKPRLPRLLGAAVKLGANISLYPNVRLDVPIGLESVTIGAGSIAGSIALDLTAVDAFSTRFASLFNEYAIVGARLEIRPNAIVNPSGICAVWLDEETAAAPNGTQSANRARLDIAVANLSDVKPYRIDWLPRDILDLDFVSTATTFTPVWLKIFSSPAATLTTATTTGQILVTGSLAFEFRGYA